MVECPTCRDCEMDDMGQDLLECPQCGAQWEFKWVGKTDTPRLPPGVRARDVDITDELLR